MSMLSQDTLEFWGLTLFQPPAYPEAQQLLDSYTHKASSLPEIDRIQLAQELCDHWQLRKYSSHLLPMIPSRQDYWYWLQLMTQNRHIHANGIPYQFKLDNSEVVYLESFPECNYSDPQAQQILAPSNLLTKMCKLAQLPNPTRFMSRIIIDSLIQKTETQILFELELSQKHYRLAPIPYDIYIRLDPSQFGQSTISTHFDGYRLRKDHKKTTLIGGYGPFGGQSFSDSLWLDTHTNHVIIRLAIIPKMYGY